MTRRMQSRGPDAEGVWPGEGFVFGHRRLAILDLDPRSNQPMVSADGRYCIVFNGEIYNFLELRDELEARGEAFRTRSDTEVLLAMYARHGEEMLPRLRGMFALAIWDAKERELFLARDPYGIKPLYYAQTRDGLVFASQVKALLASRLVPQRTEPAGVVGFYLWGSVPEPWTLYRGVLALPAGSFLKAREDHVGSPQVWRDIGKAWNEEQISCSAEELHERLRSAVTDSVRAHLVADVPVSVFLSGGIDSGTIAGLLSELGARLEGVTVRFDEFATRHEDEGPAAAALASHYGLHDHVRRVTRQEFENDLPKFLQAMDQPTVDGVNTWFASKAAAERGYKVVLSGIGGDELLYGYGLVQDISRDIRRNRAIVSVPGSRALMKKLLVFVPPGRRHPKMEGVPALMGSLEGEYLLRRGLFLPHELPLLMDSEEAREGLGKLDGMIAGMPKAVAVNGEGALCMLDSKLYLRNMLLRDSDWASMAHSLELRTPLVDAKLLEAIGPLHTYFRHGAGKKLLAGLPSIPLPEAISRRPKSGFMVPMTQWLRELDPELDEGSRSVLSRPGTPWTRRWAAVVIKSFLGPDASVHALRPSA